MDSHLERGAGFFFSLNMFLCLLLSICWLHSFQNTSVGRFAIQLAKLSGLKVATTASEKNWDKLKALGADLVVDYKVSTHL